jgi:succinoglycan biosynthesis protein ExoA
MPESQPIISVIVAAPPGKTDILSVEQSKKLNYPADKLEIIIARGKQPSVQRNRAVKEAKGELIYFLDDDSVPYVENLIRGVELFQDPQVQVVGGPNLVPPESNRLEQSFGDVMGSWLAFGPSRARYRKVGRTRPSSEKELILCNMMFRKLAFEKHGGFDEALYPNEENALMDAVADNDGKLIYDPDFLVHRRPRTTLGAFCKMLMNYGRGRAEQFRLHPTLGSAPNFVPPLFLAYLLSAPFLPLWGLWPLAAYAVVVILQALALDLIFPLSIPRLAPLILISHLFYGAGFWKGLFTKLKPKDQASDVEVSLERISPA